MKGLFALAGAAIVLMTTIVQVGGQSQIVAGDPLPGVACLQDATA